MDINIDDNVDNVAHCWFGDESISVNKIRVFVFHNKKVFEKVSPLECNILCTLTSRIYPDALCLS